MSETSGGTGATYPVATIAKLLIMTDRQVQKLAARGVLPKAEHGRYELVPVVQAYVRYLRERSLRGDADENGRDAPRARMITARARRAELEADQLEGRMLDRADVERAWQTLVLAMRSRLLAIPTQMAGQVFAARTQKEVAALLERGVADALDELSRTDIEAEAADDPADWQAGADRRGPRRDGGSEAADAEDDLAVG